VSCWFYLYAAGEVANGHIYGLCFLIAGEICEMCRIGEEDQGVNSLAFRETMLNIVKTIFLILQAIDIPGIPTTSLLCASHCVDDVRRC
jgi:hypothetical protein